MRKKVYGARQDSAWRQSVKDYSPNGGRVLHRERRRKATLSIIQDSDVAPSGWSYITVGERWNGRGRYVDLFLEELNTSPKERAAQWSVNYGDVSQDKIAIDIRLIEHRIVQRDTLQYSVNVVVDYVGPAQNIVRNKLREFAPGWYDTTVCRTEESRDLCWETLRFACERVASWLRDHLRSWRRQKEVMLDILENAGESITARGIFDAPSSGIVADTEERFRVFWHIHNDIEREPSWSMYALPAEDARGLFLELGSGDPLQARGQIACFLSRLHTSRPIEFGGRRRIEE